MNNHNGSIDFVARLKTEEIEKNVAKLEARFRQLTGRVEQEGNRMQNVFSGLESKALAFFSVYQAQKLIRTIVSIRGEFQQLGVAFETMLGNKAKADKLMSEVVDFAAKTPFNLKGVAGGTKQLLAYGIEAENIIPTLKSLGDVSAGLSVPIERLILNYGQIKTQTKLTGRDLRDFNMAGVPLIAELAKNLNKAETEIQEMVSAGKIGFKDVENAFRTMSGEGGRFANLMDKQSKTITGQISNIEDSIDQMFNKIGQSSEGVINGALSGVSYLVEHYEEVGKVLLELVATYGTYKTALIAVNAIQKATEATKRINEISELKTLLKVEEAARISKMKLVKGSEEELTAIKSVIEGRIKSEVSLAKVTNTELELAKNRLNSAKLAKQTAIENIAAHNSELASLRNSTVSTRKNTTARAINRLEKKIATEQEKLNTAATNINTFSKDVNSKRAAVNASVTRASTLETKLNTATQRANTKSLNLLTIAKTKLTAVTARVNAFMAANPYVLVTAAVTALAYATYKLITHQTELEKAQSKMNKHFDDAQISARKEELALNDLFGKLKSLKEGTERYINVKKEITSRYSEYLKGLSKEKQALNDIEGAYDGIINKMRQKYREEAANKAISEAETDYVKKETEYLKKIEESLKNKLGDKKGIEIYYKIQPKLQNNEELDKEVKDVINSLDVTAGYVSGKAVIGNDVKHYIDKIKRANYEVEKIRKDAEKRAGVVFGQNKGNDKANKEVKEEFTNRAKLLKEIAKINKEITKLEKTSKTEISKAQEEDLKNKREEVTKLKERLANLGVNTKKSSSKKEFDAVKNTREEAKLLRNAELEKEEARISIMREGAEKRQALIQLDFDRREETINQRFEDEKQKLIELAKERAKAEGKSFNPDSVNLSSIKESRKVLLEANAENYDRETNKHFKELLDKYKTFEEQKAKIAKQYDEEINALERQNQDGKYNAKIELAKAFKQKELTELEISVGDTSSVIGELYSDLTKKSASELDEMAVNGEEAFTKIKESFKDVKDPQVVQMLDNVRKKLDEIKDKANKMRSPFIQLGKDFQKYFKKGATDTEKTEALTSISNSYGKIAQKVGLVKDVFQSLSNLSGDNAMANIADGLGDAMDIANSAMQGFATGGVFGAVAGGALAIFGKITESNKRHREAILRIQQSEISQQRELNKLLFEENMLMKDKESIFGVKEISRAIGYLAIYRDEFEKLQDSLKKKDRTINLGFGFKRDFKASDLDQIAIKTGHEKTGLFGWGKGRDVYSSITKIPEYKELYSEQDGFNRKLAESILQTREFGEGGKEALQKIIDQYDHAQEAQKQFDEYLKSTFGELGGGFVDSVVNSLKTGEDAFESFSKSVGNVIGKLGKQLVEELFISKEFDKFKERLDAESEKGLSSEELGKRWATMTAEFGNSMKGKLEQAETFLKTFSENTKDLGYDVIGKNAPQAKVKGFQAMSQDVGSDLNGKFTLMVELKRKHFDVSLDISKNIKMLQQNSAQALRHLSNIDNHTSRLSNIENGISGIRTTLEDIQLKGIKIK